MEKKNDKIIPIDAKGAREKKPRRRPLRHVLFALFCLVILGGVIAFVTYRNELSSNTFADLLSRLRFSFGQGDKQSSVSITYDDYMLSQTSLFQGGLAMLSASRLSVFSPSGQERFGVECSFERPALAVSDRTVLAYDRGGRAYMLTDNGTTLLKQDFSDILYTACMNKKGAYAFVSRARGYASTVTVFDDRQRQMFTWYSATHYISGVSLSDDAKRLAVISSGQQNDQFSGRLTLLDTGKSEPVMTRDFHDALPYRVGFLGNRLFYVVTEDGLSFYDDSGQTLLDWSFDGRRPLAFGASGEGFVAVYLVSGQSTAGELVVLDSKGPRARRSLLGESVSLSVNGSYIGVLADEMASVYDEDLEQRGQSQTAVGIRSLLMRDDGTALMLGQNGSLIYRP